MELLKDYGCTIDYHPGKTNVVADALSRKSTGSLAYMQTIQLPLMVELRELGVELRMHASGALFASFQLRPILVDRILEAQLEDPYLMSMRKKVEEGEQSDFSIRDDGALVIGSRLCVLATEELKRKILDVPYTEGILLVVKDEKRSCRVCIQVLHLSTSEGRETKAFWNSTALTHPRMEMGVHYNGFFIQTPSHGLET